MTYLPDQNYSGVPRLTLDDLQTIHTAIANARSGLGDAVEALRDLQHGMNQPQDWLKKRAARALMAELTGKEVALDKALRGGASIETEIGVVTLLSNTVDQSRENARLDLLSVIETTAKRHSLFDHATDPESERKKFAEEIAAALDVEGEADAAS